MNGEPSEREERTQRIRDLVWQMRSRLDESQVRMGEVTTFLGKLEEKRSAMRARMTVPSSEPVLDEALSELDSTNEEIRVVGEEMKRRGAQLLEWEAEAMAKLRFHRRIMERAFAGFFLTDENGIIADANEEAARMLHVSPAYLHNKPIVNFVSRRDVSNARSFLRAVSHSDRMLETVMIFRPRRGGPVRVTEVRASVLERNGERALAWLVRELPTRADAKASAGGDGSATLPPSSSPPGSSPESEALATVSHELRGPIQTITTAVSLLRKAIPAGVPAKRIEAHCDSILRASATMTRMVRDLEDAAKVDAGQFSIVRERCDLRRLVEELLAAYQPRAGRRGLLLGATLPHEAVIVEADFVRLTQVVSNFLDNALKFSEPGKTVRVVLDIHEGKARVDVIDEGHGIAPSDLPHVFERRWQAQLTSSLGSGLGLWLARGIAEAHGGSVGALSVLGAGSRFWVEVPLRHE